MVVVVVGGVLTSSTKPDSTAKVIHLFIARGQAVKVLTNNSEVIWLKSILKHGDAAFSEFMRELT